MISYIHFSDVKHDVKHGVCKKAPNTHHIVLMFVVLHAAGQWALFSPDSQEADIAGSSRKARTHAFSVAPSKDVWRQ